MYIRPVSKSQQIDSLTARAALLMEPIFLADRRTVITLLECPLNYMHWETAPPKPRVTSQTPPTRQPELYRKIMPHEHAVKLTVCGVTRFVQP